MQTKVQEFLATWDERMIAAKSAAPDVPRGFGAMYATLMKDGALSLREKELIALGIGLAVRCEPCVALHVKKALQTGATRAQVLEAAGVAVMMQGGPTYTYLPYLVEAIDAVEATKK